MWSKWWSSVHPSSDFFYLKGDVADSEAVVDNLPQMQAQGFQVARVVRLDEDVCGECFVAWRECPDVDVMNKGDTLNILQFTAKLIHVNMFGRTFKQHMDNLGKQAPTTDKNENGDDHADNGIGKRPAEDLG